MEGNGEGRVDLDVVEPYIEFISDRDIDYHTVLMMAFNCQTTFGMRSLPRVCTEYARNQRKGPKVLEACRSGAIGADHSKLGRGTVGKIPGLSLSS